MVGRGVVQSTRFADDAIPARARAHFEWGSILAIDGIEAGPVGVLCRSDPERTRLQQVLPSTARNRLFNPTV